MYNKKKNIYGAKTIFIFVSNSPQFTGHNKPVLMEILFNQSSSLCNDQNKSTNSGKIAKRSEAFTKFIFNMAQLKE